MSARQNDDLRVQEAYAQAKAAIGFFETFHLTDETLRASLTDISMDAVFTGAIFRAVTSVNEELSNLSVETMASYQELPWDEIRGMRNRMTHAYFNFDNEFLIEAVHTDMPAVMAFCRRYAANRGIELEDGRIAVPSKADEAAGSSFDNPPVSLKPFEPRE